MEKFLEVLREEWNDRGSSSEKGRITFKFFPKVSLRFRSYSVHAIQLFTGHGNFGVHMERLGRSEEKMCPVCQVFDEPFHRLQECPTFREERAQLSEVWDGDMEHLPNIDVTFAELLVPFVRLVEDRSD